ncbi:MAG: thioredoxin domain-containing protein, partial [Candidatus Sungbacteria bacterium]|nr:thioredoxin domain-containing protein [Candidatus Sungbacteria bacterium]
LVLGVGVAYVGSRTRSAPQAGQEVQPVGPRDHTKGNPGAGLALIEYSDFQCPACSSYYPILKALAERHAGDMLFAYRHFPLRQIHRNADLAARASEAAALQGKFWEMHDMIFEHQSAWSDEPNARDILAGYAEALKLDVGKFRNDLDAPEIAERIDSDAASGLKAGVDGTPSFFLNGKRIQNPRSLADFDALIRAPQK